MLNILQKQKTLGYIVYKTLQPGDFAGMADLRVFVMEHDRVNQLWLRNMSRYPLNVHQ